jgi:hypothetical protein
VVLMAMMGLYETANESRICKRNIYISIYIEGMRVYLLTLGIL